MQIISTPQAVSDLVAILPDHEQNLAYELIKRMVLAWDSDYTKLTPQERNRLEAAERDFTAGAYVRHEDIDWD